MVDVLNQLSALAEEASTVTDTGMSYIAASLAILVSAGVGVGEGYTVGKACEAVGRNPEVQSKVMTLMIVGMAITETCAIYGLIIAILLIFVV